MKYGLGIPEHDTEGRAITLEFPEFYLLCVYTPNSQRELARLSYRMEWEDALREYVIGLDKIKPVVYCGDLNVAHEEIDLKNPKTNHLSAGFSDDEPGFPHISYISPLSVSAQLLQTPFSSSRFPHLLHSAIS